MEYDRQATQQRSVDGLTPENVVDVSTIAVELGCQPVGVVAFGLTIEHLFYAFAYVEHSAYRGRPFPAAVMGLKQEEGVERYSVYLTTGIAKRLIPK